MSLYSPYVDADLYGLEGAVVALGPDRVEREVLVAELVLGLVGTAFTGDNAERARSFVARQINLQVSLGGGEHSSVIQETRGRQTIRFATVMGRRVPIDELAWQGARDLRGEFVRSGSSEAVFRW